MEATGGYFVVALALYLSGGFASICLIAWKEKKRLGGKFLSHLWEDIQEQPIAAPLGYLICFLFSWITFFLQLTSEKD